MAQDLSTRAIQGALLDARTDRLINDILTEGTLTDGDEFLVRPQVSPNMTVRVGSGLAGDRYVVDAGKAQGVYIVRNPDPYIGSGNMDVSISPGDPSFDRIDGIDLQVYDDEFDSSGSSKAEIIVTEGSPSSSPSAPAVPDGAARLATVLVAAGESTSIGSGDITDTRTRAAAIGGTTVCTSMTRPSQPTLGAEVWETDTGYRRVWNGSAWVIPEALGRIGETTLSGTWSSGEQDATGTVSVTKEEGRQYRVEATVGLYTATYSGNVTVRIRRDDNTVIAEGTFQVSGSSNSDRGALNLVGYDDDGAGAATYRVTYTRGEVTNSVFTSRLRVIDDGLAS